MWNNSKLVVAAAHNASDLPYMYGFISKLKVFDIRMTGGVLGVQKTK